jgi:hypothetical protein
MNPSLKGEVVYLYAFDIAEEIQTSNISKILAKKAMPFIVRADKTVPKAIPFYHPLSIETKRETWKIQGLPLKPQVRIYEVGVISIMISLPFEVEALNELIKFHEPIMDNSMPLDKAAHGLCLDVLENIKPYLIRSTKKVGMPEAYTVFAFQEIPAEEVEPWIQKEKKNIAGLLSETEADQLSPQQIEEVFRRCISFDRKDAVIIDWDAALVVDLSGIPRLVLYVLELANLQLEELVLMDQRLDNYLDQAYDVLERKRSGLFGLPRRELRKLRRLMMDVAKITDEVANITKFFGDWYLARIYLAARDRFHIPTWRESIQNRLSQLTSLYEVFRSEVNEARMLLLEFLIVIFFIIDLLAIFFRK